MVVRTIIFVAGGFSIAASIAAGDWFAAFLIAAYSYMGFKAGQESERAHRSSNHED